MSGIICEVGIGKRKEVHEDNPLQCYFVHHKSHTDGPVGEPETNSLSYGKAPTTTVTLKGIHAPLRMSRVQDS